MVTGDGGDVACALSCALRAICGRRTDVETSRTMPCMRSPVPRVGLAYAVGEVFRESESGAQQKSWPRLNRARANAARGLRVSPSTGRRTPFLRAGEESVNRALVAATQCAAQLLDL